MRTRGQRLRLQPEQPTSLSDPLTTRQRGPIGSGVHPLAASLIELQQLAGNRAVAAEIGSWRNGRMVIGASNVDVKTHPSAPPDGVRKIRESRNGGGLLGRTVASIDPSPPLLRADAPVKVDHGWTCQAMPTRAPEPYLETYWPTPAALRSHEGARSPGLAHDHQRARSPGWRRRVPDRRRDNPDREVSSEDLIGEIRGTAARGR